MPQPKSANALPDARSFLNNVLKAEKGLKITFPDKKKATVFRFRCYTCRDRERQRNRRIYKDVDPEHNQTIWDAISLYLELQKDGTCKVVARHDDEIDSAIIVEEI